MKLYLNELGIFTNLECENIKELMENETYMKFKVSWSSFPCANNNSLIIETDYEASEEEIKDFFLSAALSKLAFLNRDYKILNEYAKLNIGGEK